MTAAEELTKIPDGDILLVGGFILADCPETLVMSLLITGAAGNLSVISTDTGVSFKNFSQRRK